MKQQGEKQQSFTLIWS